MGNKHNSCITNLIINLLKQLWQHSISTYFCENALLKSLLQISESLLILSLFHGI